MYIVEKLDDNAGNKSNTPTVMRSLSQSIPLEQWHRRLAHCSLLTIKEMIGGNLVDGLQISEDEL
jgi:hypothetical protein